MEKISIDCGDHTIELTQQELHSIYEFKDLEYLIEDVESELEEMNLPENKNAKIKGQINRIAELSRHYLERNDLFWDIYWENIRCAIKEYMDDEE